MRLSSWIGRWLLGAAGLLAAGAASAQPVRDVTIGLSSNSLGAAGFRIAKELGLFEKHNLAARIVIMDSGNSVTAALISGSVQAVTAGMGDLIAARARHLPIVAVTNTYGGLSGTMVIAKSVADKLGVSPTASWQDRMKALDGLSIASASATSSNAVAYQAAANVVGARIRSVYMAQDTMPAALESGAIQGFVSASPFWAFPVERGAAVLWMSGPKGELPENLRSSTSNMVLVGQSFAEAHPDIVRDIDAVYGDFVKALDERPADVEAIIAKLYPTLDKPTIDMLFGMESFAWKARKLTPADVVKEIGFTKKGNSTLPGLDDIDPAAALWQIK
jgi:ABC-type nitrate/sulfonate/bicarbonate transport system substrate-binding protein